MVCWSGDDDVEERCVEELTTVFFSVVIVFFWEVRCNSAHGGRNAVFGPVLKGDYRRHGPSWVELRGVE